LNFAPINVIRVVAVCVKRILSMSVSTSGQRDRKTDKALWLEATEEAGVFKALKKTIRANYTTFDLIGHGVYGYVFRATKEDQRYAVKIFTDLDSGPLEARQEVRVMLYLKKVALQDCLLSEPNALQCCPKNLICYTKHFRARLDLETARLIRAKRQNEQFTKASQFHCIESNFIDGKALHIIIIKRLNSAIDRLGLDVDDFSKLNQYHNDSKEISKQYVRNGPSLEQILSFMHTTLSALNFMHEHGAFHRDIHTGNIMLLNKDSYRPEGVLLDVGISCVKDECTEFIESGAFGQHRLEKERKILRAAYDYEADSTEPSVREDALSLLIKANLLKWDGSKYDPLFKSTPLSQKLEAAIDVYALGTVFYYYVSGILPIWIDGFKIDESQVRERFDYGSPEMTKVWLLIEAMINIDISQRASAFEAKQRAFVLLTDETSWQIKKKSRNADDDDDDDENEPTKLRNKRSRVNELFQLAFDPVAWCV